jgi:LmbE family N-acetylglucosaminyl deacetylase/CheY-like chemotaxis protein
MVIIYCVADLMVRTDNKSGRQARILVIDSDENSRKAAYTILKEKGFDVDTTESGTEAIAKTQQNTYNLMLIADNLPDMAETKLLTRIHETIPKIRKIIITGYPKLQNAISAVNQGADAFLIKPFDKEKMLDTIEEQLEKQQSPFCKQNCTGANILFIGAHPDDIELGCGGTLIKHVQNGDNAYALIFTNGEKGMAELNEKIDRQQESTQALTLAGVPLSNIYFLQYPDTELWQHRQEVMNAISKFCETFQIQLIYTHSNKAHHQDHVTIFDETMRGAKKTWGIMAYESHGATNPAFSPTLFVDITDVIAKKIAMLNFHQSQISKNSLKIESVVALAQFRSSQSEEFHYAEAFEIIKMNLSNHSGKEISIQDIFKIGSDNSRNKTLNA